MENPTDDGIAGKRNLRRAPHLHQVGFLRDGEFVDPFGVLVGEGLDFFLEVLLSVFGDEVVGLSFKRGVHS